MSFNIPNQGDALADAQSILFKEHIDILIAGVEGNGITSGCAVAPSAGMVISVAAGAVTRVGVAATTSAATPTVAAAHATLHRFDAVVITAANAVAIRQGTAAAQPKPPALTAGDIALAMVFVPAAATSIAAGNITDARVDVYAPPILAAIADSSLGSFGYRNKIINGGFGINQRAYISGAATTAGQYTLDRWKVTGTGGITFSTTANKTTVTIPTGQALQQVIEGLNLQSGTYVLSWEGTAQGKIGAGSLGASGITGSITGGTNTTIEFGPGTVANVQLEFGSVATPFEHRPYGTELALCQRYYKNIGRESSGTIGIGGYCTGSIAFITLYLGTPMRATPTLIGGTYSLVSSAGTTAVTSILISDDGGIITLTSTNTAPVGGSCYLSNSLTTGARGLNAEL